MATVLSGLTAPAHSTPSALFHNPEAPSLLTFAEQPRGHIMGQLQKAGGAGPAVLRDLAGCTLPAAHTLPGRGEARSQAQAVTLGAQPLKCLLTLH